MTASSRLDQKLASALGSAEGYKRLADRHEKGKKVAQAYAKWLKQQLDDARTEIEKPLGALPPEERLRRVKVILDKRPPVIKV